MRRGMFNIRFTGRAMPFGRLVDELDTLDAARPVIKGRIQLGDYWESFISPLDVWTQEDYESQWVDARKQLATGKLKSCFVVAVDPPRIKSAVEIWGVWRLDQEFRIQNLHLFPEDGHLDDLHQPYAALRDYTNLSVDGDRVHDWRLPLDTVW